MKKVAQVSFFDREGNVNDYKKYDYKTLLHDLKEGDLVVVETRNGYQVAEFQGYSTASTKANAFIVQRIDTDKVKIEKEKQEQIEELKRSIALRAKEIEERKRLNELAGLDPEIKLLLDQLDELKK